MMDAVITTKTKNMIDDLKSVCANFGLGNSAGEYKIITEVFLYKFLNDKFLYAVRKENPDFQGLTAAQVEEKLASMDGEEYAMTTMIGSDAAVFKKKHLISFLYNHRNQNEFIDDHGKRLSFHELFDNTLKDIADSNIDVFSVRAGKQSKMRLFSGISGHILDDEKKDTFCRAILDKIVNTPFDSVFEQKYDFFAQIFEYLIKDYNKDFGKYAEYYTPQTIAMIIARILAPDGAKNVTLYDPAAGTGTLVLALAHQIGEGNCTIYTQDISQKSNEFLRLNLILNNLVHSLPNVIHDDTLLFPFHKNARGDKLAQFDYIVSNPPFNLDFSDNRDTLAGDNYKERFWAGVPKVPPKDKDEMAVYLMFLQHIVYSLKDGGQAAVVVPTGFLTASKRSLRIAYDIRKEIIEKKWLQGVISMPTHVFANTTTNVSILFLSKKDNRMVMMLDASKCGISIREGKNTRTVLQVDDIENIVGGYLNKVQKDKFGVVVETRDLIKHDYSLGIANYFMPDLSHNDLSEKEYQQKLFDYRKTMSCLFNYDYLCAEAVKKIFDYWFVQYDFPYNGKPYKSSGGDMKIDDRLHKKIPVDWEVKSLKTIVDILLGGTPDTNNASYWDGTIPWLNSGEIAQFPIYSSEKTITELGLRESATSYAKKGAVLLSITRYIRSSILSIDACFNQSVVAIIPNENYPTSFLYPFIETQISRYMALRTGAQQPHINKNTVEETMVAVPPAGSNIMEEYVQETQKVFMQILEDTRKAAQEMSIDMFDMPNLLDSRELLTNESR